MIGPLPRPARLVVMISGGGRSLLNLLDSIRAGELDAVIAAVIASRPCPGAERAAARGLPVVIEGGVIPAAKLEVILREHRADLVVLAGYLKLVDIPPGYAGRFINIHPALLPAFGGHGMYGRRVHEAVLASGATESGCTVHFCDGAFDRGPIILQERCQVMPGDTAETLAARVFGLECRALPRAVQLVIDGKV